MKKAVITCFKCAVTIVALLNLTTTSWGTNSKTFNVTCDPGQRNERSCQNNMTLVGIADFVKKQSHTQININIMIPVLHLNETVRFSNLNSLSIVSEYGPTAIMCPANDNAIAGMLLSNITDTIRLKNFNMSFCGSSVETRKILDNVEVGADIPETFSSALIIAHSRNVEMSQIVIANSSGLGLTVLDHRGGKVELLSTSFLENKLPKEYMERRKQGLRGGGVYIAVEQHTSGRYSDTSFAFEDCKFLNNDGTGTHYTLAHTQFERYGQGGGAYVSLKHDSPGNTHVLFLRCQFIANQAYTGGGLSVSVQGENNNHNTKVSVEVVQSIFENNGCDEHAYTQNGGALQLEILESDAPYTRQSKFSVNNVTFVNNCAEIGGAIHYVSHQGTANSNAMLFDECMFEQNRAHIGSAVAMIPDRSLKLFTGNKLNPTFQNCYFQDNVVFNKHFQYYDQTQTNDGIGTVYTSSYNCILKGPTCFKTT